MILHRIPVFSAALSASTADTAKLNTLYHQLRAEVDTPVSVPTKDVLNRCQELISVADADPYAVRVAELEMDGFQEGWKGQQIRSAASIETQRFFLRTEELETLSAENFLFWVQSGRIKTRGGRTSQIGEMAADAFLLGAKTVFSVERRAVPAFLKGVASAWAKLAIKADRDLKYSVESYQSYDMGVSAAQCLQDSLRLGQASGLPHSLLESHLHLRDIPAAIRARGWLSAQIERLWQPSPELNARESRERVVSAKYLESNHASIVQYLFKTGDLGYVRAVMRAMGSKGNLVRQLDDGITQLAQQGHVDSAIALRASEGSIIYHALSSGKLTAYITQVLDTFEGKESFLFQLESAINARSSEEEVERLNRNIKTLTTDALAQGLLDPEQVVLNFLNRRSQSNKRER